MTKNSSTISILGMCLFCCNVYAASGTSKLTYPDFGFSITPPVNWIIQDNDKANQEYLQANEKYGNDKVRLSKVSIMLFSSKPGTYKGDVKKQPSLYCIGMLADILPKLILKNARDTWVKREKGAVVSEIKLVERNNIEFYEFSASMKDKDTYTLFSAFNNKKSIVMCGAATTNKFRKSASDSLLSISKE